MIDVEDKIRDILTRCSEDMSPRRCKREERKKEEGINEKKSCCWCAGVNKGLPDDFTWPRGFGVGGNGNVSRLSEGKTINVPPITANPSSLTAFENSFSYVDINVTQKSVLSEQAHSQGKTENYVIPSVNSSKKSQVSLDLQKKRLFIQTEKDRQELERMKEDLEKKELKEAELAAAADEENDDTNRSVSSKVKADVKEFTHFIFAIPPKRMMIISSSNHFLLKHLL
ncbi:hypothetical protein JTB14_011248 [Gonioctena quinquepunctata]|nr:hypothetical protein JTB14_011248 [Gonioctena quinquepunctata]